METSQKILSTIVALLVILEGYQFVSSGEPTHYCESREIKSNCLRLSSTRKTCYALEKGWRCLEGWEEIPTREIQKLFSSRIIGCKPRPKGCEAV